MCQGMGQPLEAGKGEEIDSPLEPPEGVQPQSSGTSDLQNFERINVSDLKL